MRLAQFVQRYPPALGGSEAYIQRLSGFLVDGGDSVTVWTTTALDLEAFWSPLAYQPKNMPPDMAKALTLVKANMKEECWSKWKGPDFGSNGSMTIRWAHDNVDKWLSKHNPETVLIMFGTNDLGQLQLKEYEDKTRAVVQRCLKNGTVVILSTIPPRHVNLEQARQYAAAVHKVAAEEKGSGVRVTSIYPGEVNTPILDQRPQPVSDELRQQMLQPEDVALVVEVSDVTLQRDRGFKKRVYAQAGIPVYWILNLPETRLEMYEEPASDGGQPDYRRSREYGADEEAPLVIGGVEVARIRVRELLP